jgi:hypothetical protein
MPGKVDLAIDEQKLDTRSWYDSWILAVVIMLLTSWRWTKQSL